MPKLDVEIKLLFSGDLITLFLIDDDELAELISNAKLHSPKPYYEIIDKTGDEIYLGIDPIDGDLTIEILIDGKPIIVEGYNLADDSDEAKNLRLINKNKVLINSDNLRSLEGDIPKNMHALIIREYLKDAEANCFFESDKVVCASDFELILSSSDSDSDYADVTYHADLLSTECDVVGIELNGIENQPEITVQNIQSQEVFLFVRNAKGQLKKKRNFK
jgi:hypothetical protein